MEEILVQNLQQYKSILIGCVIALVLSSCGDSENKDIITGGADAEIQNLHDSTVHLFSYQSPLEEVKGHTPFFDEKITVDSNGIFIYPHVFPEGFYFFEYDGNKTKYFIQEGKKLSLDFDATKPTESPDFSGKMKYESRYLFEKHLAIANFTANESKYYALSENDFMEVVNQFRGRLDTVLVMYITNRPMGSNYFMQQESLSNLYLTATLIEDYQMKHSMYTNDSKFTASDSFLLTTKKLSVNDTVAVANSDFYAFLEARVNRVTGSPENYKSVFNRITFIDSTFTVSDYKDYLFFTSTREVAKWKNTEDRTEILDSLISRVSDEDIKRFLIQNIQSDTATPVATENINSSL